MATAELELLDEGLPVRLPSGATFPVLTRDEVAYLEERSTLYLQQNHFTNVSDLQDLDGILMMELLAWRWSIWLSRQRDYFGDQIDESGTRRMLAEYSKEIRQKKSGLGIDKPTRDKEKGDDSLPAYIANLRRRAREFGVFRENQLAAALTLFNQLSSLVGLHDRCDEHERRELHVTQQDVIEWVREVALPEYRAIDEHFRTQQQKLWVRTL